MKSKFLWISIFSLLLTGFYSSVNAQKVDFNTQIKPLLEHHCMECHNADGDSYPIEVKDDAFSFIVEGEPEESDMYLVMVTDDEDDRMPPADYERQMSDDQIELIKTWIADGAEWPDDATFVMPAATAASDAIKDTAKDSIDPRILKATGSLHPAILHLPMGLLLASGLFAFLSLRGNFVMSDCAYYCLWLGVLTSILACVTGWFYSDMQNKGTVTEFMDIFEQDHEVYWHRLSALISTIFGLLVALYAMGARAKDPDEGATWKLGAIILAAGIGYVGFTGGKLQYPSNHYKDLNELWTEMISSFGDEDRPAVESGEDAMTDDADSDGSMDLDGSLEQGSGNTQSGDLSLSGST